MSFFDQTKITDSNGNVINPGTEESILLLRRIVKQLEGSSVVDGNQRQRVTIDAGTLPTVTTVSTVSNMSTLSNVDARYLLIDTARNAYANGIRSKLNW